MNLEIDKIIMIIKIIFTASSSDCLLFVVSTFSFFSYSTDFTDGSSPKLLFGFCRRSFDFGSDLQEKFGFLEIGDILRKKVWNEEFLASSDLISSFFASLLSTTKLLKRAKF